MTAAYPDPEVVLPALAALEKLVPGVREAYANAPRSLVAANMPCFVNIPGPSTYDWNGAGGDEEGREGYETRTYYAVLFVAPAETGASGERFADCLPFLARFRNLVMGRQTLANGVLGLTYTGDSGIRNDLRYAGQDAFGIRFEIAITGRIRVDYDDRTLPVLP